MGWNWKLSAEERARAHLRKPRRERDGWARLGWGPRGGSGGAPPDGLLGG